MAYFKPLVGGMAVGNLIFMNHVYENELLKQQIRDEVTTLKKMRDFVSLLKALIFCRPLINFWSSEILTWRKGNCEWSRAMGSPL
jgi:hypothetical protein